MAVVRPGDAHHARSRLHGNVHTSFVGQDTFHAVSRNVGVNKFGINFLQALIIQPQSLGHARPEVLHYNVGPGCQFFAQGSPLWGFHFNRHAALVPVYS